MAQAPKSITDPRVRFFYANAGYAKKAGESVHSATLRNAKALADAENYAEDHGWTYQWEEDPQGYDSLGEDEDPEDIEVLWVQLLDESGASLASLGGVNLRKDRGIKDKYARVVEAELALEAMVESEPQRNGHEHVRLKCDMALDCQEPVTHIDNKGYAYCTKHGEQRKAYGTPCRKLRPSEITKLEQGGTTRYR
jgi:hypothetical protein